MKILSRTEFMKLPIGTVWSYYEPCCFHDLNIKASDLNEGYVTDFLYDGIIGSIQTTGSDDFVDKCDLMERGESISMDFESTSREGLFEDEQLFAIFEEDDLKKLILRLQKALNGNSL